jgi:perosamine synthetase
MQFIIPREPLLVWSMLYPASHREELPSPLNVKPTYYVFWARNAIYHGLRTLGLSADDNVLVPSFHCATVVEPIVRSGGRVKFYKVRS